MGFLVRWQVNVDHLESFYIFGGLEPKRQISKVIGYRLTLVGNLDFDHEYGSASLMSEGGVFFRLSLTIPSLY